MTLNMKKGYFGEFGGQFIPEFLYPAVTELEAAFEKAIKDSDFQEEYDRLLSEFAGRPTPLYFAKNTSEYIGCKIYFKREDLLNGGSHKINNALGQALLAKYMGKTKIITETAAGMHGVATTVACNVVGLTADVYMGEKDIARQTVNADKIRMFGGKVIPVTRGHGVLKDAVSEALVAWIRDLPSTHYLIGSAVGPHPFPTIVAYFQRFIGQETRKDILKKEGRLPTSIIACGSGGSNAIGMYQAFIKDESVELVFVEGGGENLKGGKHAAAFHEGSVGIFQGAKTYLIQDEHGMDRKTESRSAGLNYPARGPQLAHLFSTGRLKGHYATDKQVLEAYFQMAKMEGLLPAFETCHAIAELFKRKGTYKKNDIVVLSFSGRGDKDLETAMKLKESL
jgi:tryptophan synthase beta chain